MFKNSKDNEADFCESYKSQILGNTETEKGNSFFSTIVKLLTILILLVIIAGVSFYGYNYFMNSSKMNNTILPPVSTQISDEDLVVQMEEETEAEEIELVKEDLPEVAAVKKITIIKKEEEPSLPPIMIEQVEESDIDKIANDVKIAIAKSEVKEENETSTEKVEEISESIHLEVNDTEEIESLEIPTSAPEAKYLEELADLSKEIDKERNN